MNTIPLVFVKFQFLFILGITNRNGQLEILKVTVNFLKWINVILFLLLLLMNSSYSYAQEPGPSEDPIIMRIIKLDYADAEQLVFTLEPFLSPQGRIMAYTPTNSLIIKDRQSIVEDLVRAIKGKWGP
jgi:type II secretory pathway component GspD/PulD (secretin)